MGPTSPWASIVEGPHLVGALFNVALFGGAFFSGAHFGDVFFTRGCLVKALQRKVFGTGLTYVLYSRASPNTHGGVSSVVS